MNIQYMKQALQLAEKGYGFVSPNPLVGAVIVKNNAIISEGWHARYGEAHAEINAIESASEDVRGAEMYVTLEPCSHYGKTPPCADAIIAAKISKVYVAMEDPNPLVRGRGIAKLRAAGIEVISNILEDEARKLNEVFIHYITTKMPYCILKTAMTLDGKIATKSGDSQWISDETSRKHAHLLRHRYSGIMVGIGTVLEDDPSLTCRLENGKGKDPHRIIVDTQGRTSPKAKVLNQISEAKTFIAVAKNAPVKQIKALEETGAQVLCVTTKKSRVNLHELMASLGQQGIDSILVEGGSELAFSLLQEDLIDKVLVYIAPKIVGGCEAKTPVGGEGVEALADAFVLERLSVKMLENDAFLEAYVKKGGSCLQA